MANISFLGLNNEESIEAIDVIISIAEEGNVNMFDVDGVIDEIYHLGVDWLVNPILHNIDEYLEFISEGEEMFEGVL